MSHAVPSPPHPRVDHAADAPTSAHIDAAGVPREVDPRSLVENLPDAIWSATPGLRTTFMSPQAASICGSRAIEGDGAILRRLERVDPEQISAVIEAYFALLTTRRPVDVEYRWLHPDGRWIWVRERASVVTSPEGCVERIDGFLTDITERKHLEEPTCIRDTIGAPRDAGIGRDERA